jgi:hypothetical protein
MVYCATLLETALVLTLPLQWLIQVQWLTCNLTMVSYLAVYRRVARQRPYRQLQYNLVDQELCPYASERQCHDTDVQAELPLLCWYNCGGKLCLNIVDHSSLSHILLPSAPGSV